MTLLQHDLTTLSGRNARQATDIGSGDWLFKLGIKGGAPFTYSGGMFTVDGVAYTDHLGWRVGDYHQIEQVVDLTTLDNIGLVGSGRAPGGTHIIYPLEKSLAMSGNHEGAAIASTADFRLDTYTFFWRLRPSTAVGARILFSNAQDPLVDGVIPYLNSSAFKVQHTQGPAASYHQVGAFSVNENLDIICKYDGTTSTIFFKGVKYTKPMSTPINGTGVISLWGYFNNTQAYFGECDEYKIYKTDLTDEQCEDLLAGTVVDFTNLVFDGRFSAPFTDILADKSGRENHVSLNTNMTWETRDPLHYNWVFQVIVAGTLRYQHILTDTIFSFEDVMIPVPDLTGLTLVQFKLVLV